MTSAYQQQLATKVERLQALLATSGTPPLSVYPSPAEHYRMRAEFRIWHAGDEMFHAMFDSQTRKPYRVDQFPPAATLINQLMSALIAAVQPVETLRRKLFQVDYLLTTRGEALISLLYHRQLDAQWQQAAEQLRQQLAAVAPVSLIGRARKQKLILGTDALEEQFTVQGRTYRYRQVENAFSQPNAVICQAMLDWASTVTAGSDGDLLELYCGNGNFTLPLTANFRRVMATELSRVSVASAQWALAASGVDNVTVVRAPAEEVAAALAAGATQGAGLDLQGWDCRTLLVDPPRAGLDEQTRALAGQFERILYISCNPETLARDLASWQHSHQLVAAALFDQFPFTEHIESGVYLVRRQG